MLKKMVSVLLTLTMLAGIVSVIPFTVSAEEAELTGVSADADSVAAAQGADSQSEEEKLFDDIQYVKYSDLFYAYPDALTQSQYLPEYHTKLYLFTNAIYDEYRQTDSFFWSTLSDAIQNKLSIKSALKTITDAAGWTKFTYNDGLDAANVTFAQNMFKNYNKINGVAKDLKALNKNISDAQKMLDYLNTQSNQMAYDDFFEAIKDYNVYVYVPSSEIDKLREAVRPDFSKLSDALKVTGEAASAFQYMTVALMIENFRLEVIDDILANCEQGTMLYDGMLRLKNQLRNGFSSYFVDNYLKSEIISTITDEIFDKMSVETFFADKSFKILTVVARVASKIILDEIWQYPTVDDIVKQMILSEYELNLYDALKTKADSFKTQFDTSRIFEYETLFTAYAAASKASLSACEGFIKPVTSEMSAETKNKYYELVNLYGNADLYTEHIHSSLYLAENLPPIRDNPTNFGAWTLKTNTTLRESCNVIEDDNTIYAPLGELSANISIRNYTLEIPAEAKVKIVGDIISSAVSSKINNNGELQVIGDVSGSINITNNGIMECDGKLSLLIMHTETSQHLGKLTMSDDALLKLKGDYYCSWETTYYFSNRNNIGGTIEFCGDKMQTVSNLYANNIIVTNTKGIQYLSDLMVVGEYQLNGNPIDNNGKTTLVYNNTKLDDVSDYHNIALYENWSINHDVIANISIRNYTLEIPAEAKVKIVGDIISSAVSSKINNNGELQVIGDVSGSINITNNGIMECDGKLSLLIMHTETSQHLGKLTMSDDALLKLKGDYYCSWETTYYFSNRNNIGGTIEFCGDKMQTVSNLYAKRCIISNNYKDGIVFSGTTKFDGLFDHHQNQFTLQNGGTFIDFDGDGKKDNVDPYPTNPENIEPKIIDVKINVNDKAKVLLQNQEFNKYNVTITATYWGGSKKVLDYSINVDTSSLGTQNATVTYNSGEYQFEVEVVDSITQPFQENENATWTLDSNGTMTINGTGDIPPYVRWEFEEYSDIIKEVRIEGNIQRVGFDAFSRLPNLQKVDLGNTVEEIDPMAFAENEHLTTIVLPESVTTIGSNAFSYTGITELSIPASVTTLEGYALSDCPNLEKVTILGEISELPYGMFSYCQKLESISIPNTVTEVQADAFNNCSSLKDIYYGGTEEEWTAISINESNNDLSAVTIHYNSQMPKKIGFAGHSISLKGDIGINFYVNVPDEDVSDGKVKVNFAWAVDGTENTHSVTLSANDKHKLGYKASCPVAVAEMTYDVTATIIIDGVAQGIPDTYSVQKYAKVILNNENDFKNKYIAAENNNGRDGAQRYDHLITLIQTMLDYGTKAQITFSRDIEHPANEGTAFYDDDSYPVTADMITAKEENMDIDLSEYGLRYKGSTVVYLSETSIRHYYYVDDWDSFNKIKDSMTFDGVAVTYTEKDDAIYFEKKDVSASNLDTPYTLTIKEKSCKFAVNDYIRHCLESDKVSDNTKALVKATYRYNVAANIFFEI